MIMSDVREIQIPEGNVRSIMRGREKLWGRLPGEYQEVSYVQSDGNCYFRTGVVPTDKTRMEIRIYTTCTDSFYVSGSRSAGGTIYFGQTGTRTKSRVSGSVNESSVQASTDGTLWSRVSSGQMYDIMLQTNGDETYDYVVNDTTYDKSFEAIGRSYTAMGDVSDNYDICIFALSGSYIIGGINRLYKYKLYQNGNLVRDFVPCYRLSDGEIGLYDIVTRTFFENAGTGTLTKGEILWDRLPDDYQEVEYIESTGTQYIDTGIASTQYITAHLDMQFTQHSSSSMIIIAWSTGAGRWFGKGSLNTYSAGVGAVSDIDALTRKEIEVFFTQGTTGFIIDGVTYSKATTSSKSDGYTLFAGRNVSSGVAYYANAKLYKATIQENGKIIRDFVPCYRKSDGEIGMYDTVTKVFYQNAGTGTFTKGADV